MSVATAIQGLSARWKALSTRNKWLVGGGAGLLLVLAASGSQHGGYRNDMGGRGQNPYANGPPNGAQGYGDGDGSPRQQGGDGQAYGGGGYAPANGGYAPGYQPPPSQQAANGGGDAANTDGYWRTQRSNAQRAQAFSDTIRENNTVRNNDDGTITTDVPNAVADPAIASGGYSQVPTSELPTSTPEPAPAPE